MTDRVVVTGGAGFIGATLCRELVRSGELDVVVVDDLSTGRPTNLAGLDVDLREVSVLDEQALAEAVRGAASVVHLAAVPSVPRSVLDPRRSHDVNATGTLAVLDAARAVGAHVLVASSSSVYGPGAELPKHEDMVCRPASPYAVSKLATEAYTQAYRSCYGLAATAFRFFNVYGPLQAPGHAYAAVIPSFVHAALHDQPLVVHGDGEQSRDFTFVDTVASVLAAGVRRRATSDTPLNLAFGSRTTLNHVIALLSALLGRRLHVEHSAPRAGDVKHSQASNTRLRALLPEVRPVPLEEGLRRTVEWMESLAAPPPTLSTVGRADG